MTAVAGNAARTKRVHSETISSNLTFSNRNQLDRVEIFAKLCCGSQVFDFQRETRRGNRMCEFHVSLSYIEKLRDAISVVVVVFLYAKEYEANAAQLCPIY